MTPPCVVLAGITAPCTGPAGSAPARPETPQEEVGELIAALREREDLDQVMTHLEGEALKGDKPAEPPSSGEAAQPETEGTPEPQTEAEAPAEQPPEEETTRPGLCRVVQAGPKNFPKDETISDFCGYSL